MDKSDAKSYKEYLINITTFIFDVDGVLTDGTITVTTDGEMLRNMSIKDGFALKTAVDAGFKVCIISGGSNEGVRKRLRGLGITDIYLGAHHKIEQLDEYLDIYNINPESVLYMGDDIPDYPVMKLVGLPCCPQDAAPEIKAISKYISHKNGGKGAVRDVIEQVLKVHGKWNSNFDAKYD
ncbi:MAG: HAD-IIIA family hydrolase [Bacteroidota bacterium]